MTACNVAPVAILQAIQGIDIAAQGSQVQTAIEQLGGATSAEHTASGVCHCLGMLL